MNKPKQLTGLEQKYTSRLIVFMKSDQQLDVSKSDYYAAKNRQKGKREESNQKLLGRIISVHEKYPAMGLDSLYRFLKNLNLKIDAPNTVWVGDITYIPVQESWLYHTIGIGLTQKITIPIKSLPNILSNISK